MAISLVRGDILVSLFYAMARATSSVGTFPMARASSVMFIDLRIDCLLFAAGLTVGAFLGAYLEPTVVFSTVLERDTSLKLSLSRSPTSWCSESCIIES